MREKPSIAEEQLRTCLQDEYGVSVVTLEFLPLGLDFHAGVFRVASETGTTYLLKVTSRPLYEPSRLVPRSLHDQGIAAVVAPLPTTQNALWTRLGGWTVTLYPFIEGDRGWTPALTDAQWQALGASLKRIHGVILPLESISSLRRETFETHEYAHWVQRCDIHLSRGAGASPAEQTLRTSWMEHQSTIRALLAAIETLAVPLRSQSGPHVICHADLHSSNLIRDNVGRVFVIDWDDVMLAPKERDLIFIGDMRAGGLPGTAAFFQGYGPTEIDWVALTYYRHERIVQDVIECARDVLFRDDLEEDTRVEAARLFASVLAPGNGMLTAARTAATHLPADLSLSDTG